MRRRGGRGPPGHPRLTPEGVTDGNDRDLLARISQGDTAALTALYERFGDRLYAFLCRLARDEGTAEEILQDTLFAVWRSAGAYQGWSSVSTWLFGVARRQAYNRLRGEPPPVAAEPRDLAEPVPGPEERALEDDWLQGALAMLPLAHREVVVLHFLCDLGYPEIAEVLDIPLGTVKSRVHHARAKLRECLGEHTTPR
ncbi:RNA polymerase sigma factor [Nonomuraea sp. NPDC050536]|uniref:RNA polymerase sigma factor n=1 Tax=Nonomuraea sp. NPDC050536 TaxID=3364366 RepID=UPI0037C80BC1